jgi:hypothetical protein
MNAARARKSNSEVERYYFERFRAVYPVPGGTPVYGDKPDVIMEGERKLGVEITNFFLKSGALPESEQRQRQPRADVVSQAHALYRAGGGKGIELTISFDLAHPITPMRKKKLPCELVALAARIDTQPSGEVDRHLLLTMPEILSVYLNAREYSDAKWRVIGIYKLGFMSAAGLEAIIREKELKAAEYKQCDAYWLLIIVEGMDSAQEQEIRVDGLRIASDVFERIIVYRLGFEHIIVVKE